MLADFATPGPSGASRPITPSRRGTFEDDLISPSQGMQNTSNLGSPRNLLNVSTGPARRPTIYDQIKLWFSEIIKSRKLRAIGCGSALASLVFYFSISILSFSIWSPISSFSACVSSLFSLLTVTLVLVVLAAYATSSTILMSMLVSVDQPSRASLLRTESWLSCGAQLIVNLLACKLLTYASSSPYSAGLPGLMLSMGVVFATYCSVMRRDYQLNFTGNSAQLTALRSLSSLFSFSPDSSLYNSVLAASRMLFGLSLASLVMGPLIFGLGSLIILIDPYFYFTFLVIVSGQLFVGSSFVKIVRQMVMQPLSFPLPPAYFVHSPTPEQTRTLVNVLESNDKLLALFAFFDLRRIAWMDAKRRADIFSLSQPVFCFLIEFSNYLIKPKNHIYFPGGHPRNWSSVFSACVRVIDETRTQVEMACAQLTGGAPELEDEEEDLLDRQMLLMPMKARNQLYNTVARNRHRVAMRPPPPKKVPSATISWVNSIASILSDETPVISRNQASTVTYAVEGLYKLVVESYHEDRYGVVLKDLPTVVRSIVALITSIDKYFRARASVVTCNTDATSLRQIDATLHSAIVRIHAKFGEHLKSMGLTASELNVLRAACQSEP